MCRNAFSPSVTSMSWTCRNWFLRDLLYVLHSSICGSVFELASAIARTVSW